MKLILRADVENLGSLGDVVEVSKGYGRNFLIPQGFAMMATPASLKVFELERRKLESLMNELRGAAKGLATKLESENLVITMRVGDNDKLYGSVTTHLIAEKLAEKGVEVDRRRVLLDGPIRSLGEYEVRIRLHADVVATLKLTVAAEERANFEDEAPVAAKAPEVQAEEVSAE